VVFGELVGLVREEIFTRAVGFFPSGNAIPWYTEADRDMFLTPLYFVPLVIVLAPISHALTHWLARSWLELLAIVATWTLRSAEIRRACI
jgi:hypothetical protein